MQLQRKISQSLSAHPELLPENQLIVTLLNLPKIWLSKSINQTLRKMLFQKEKCFNMEKNIKVKIILHFNQKEEHQLIDKAPSEADSYQA